MFTSIDIGFFVLVLLAVCTPHNYFKDETRTFF